MNKTKLLSIAVIGLLLINLATLGLMFFKQGRPHPEHGPRGEGPKKIIIERLNFDAAQQEKYEVIIKEHRSKMQELNKNSRGLHDELYSLLTSANIDKVKSDSLIQTIADNQKALDNLNFDHFQKIKAICTDKQLENFNGLARDLAQLFGPHGGPPK
ncbi:MAG: periplasmic heavy metal sensor [Bacteroidetes bacterium]|nr:periplasmic heavy metal sensor [Bacteroidota bacterium]